MHDGINDQTAGSRMLVTQVSTNRAMHKPAESAEVDEDALMVAFCHLIEVRQETSERGRLVDGLC